MRIKDVEHLFAFQIVKTIPPSFYLVAVHYVDYI